MSTPNQRITKREFALGYILLNVVLALHVLSWQQSKLAVSHTMREQFINQTDYLSQLIEHRIHESQEAIKNGERFLKHSNEISIKEFNTFFEKEDDERYAGVEKVTYLERVKESERETFVKGVREDKSLSAYGNPFFDIHINLKKDEYYIAKYVQPYKDNMDVFGNDYSSDTELNVYFEEAIKTGKPTLTPLMELQNRSKALLIQAIFNKDELQNEWERRMSLKGFLVVTLLPDRMFDGLLPEDSNLKLKVFDKDVQITKDGVLEPVYEDAGEKLKEVSKEVWSRRRTLMFGSQTWTAVFISYSDQKNKLESMLPDIYFIAGTLCTIVMFTLLAKAIADSSP